MHRIISVSSGASSKLHLTFDDGISGIVDVADLAGRGVFEIWNERKVFEAVSIGDYGELRWGASVDLCPDSLYLRLTGKKPRKISRFLGIVIRMFFDDHLPPHFHAADEIRKRS